MPMFPHQPILPTATANTPPQERPSPSSLLDSAWVSGRTHAWLLALLILLNLIPIWSAAYPPLQDYPDWLLQAQILRHLHDPSFDFAGNYSVHITPIPNSASILLIYALSGLVPIETAGKLVLSLYTLALPLSALYLLRGVQRRASALEMIVVLWVYNYFFYRGYIGYLLTAVLLFLLLGFIFRRWPRIDFPTLAALLVGATIIFLGHLLAWGTLILVVGFLTLIWWRKLAPKQIAALGLALAPSLLLFVNFAAGGVREFLLMPYPNLVTKAITYLYVLLLSFTNRPWGDVAPPLLVNAVLAAVLLGVFVHALLASRRSLAPGQSLLRSPTIFAVGLGLLTIAAVMPIWLSGLTRPDERVFFPAMLILFSAVRWPRPTWRYDLILGTLAGGLFILNLATFARGGAEIARIVDALPQIITPGTQPYIIRVPGSCAPTPGDEWLPVIEPAPRAAFYLTIRRGGHNRQIFDTSFIVTREGMTEDRRIPWPLSLNGLKQKLPVLQREVLPDYSTVLLAGCPRQMQEIAGLLADDFRPAGGQHAAGEPSSYLLLLQRTRPVGRG